MFFWQKLPIPWLPSPARPEKTRKREIMTPVFPVEKCFLRQMQILKKASSCFQFFFSSFFPPHHHIRSKRYLVNAGGHLQSQSNALRYAPPSFPPSNAPRNASFLSPSSNPNHTCHFSHGVCWAVKKYRCELFCLFFLKTVPLHSSHRISVMVAGLFRDSGISPPILLRPALIFLSFFLFSTVMFALFTFPHTQVRTEYSLLSYRVEGLEGLLVLWLQLADEVVELWDDLLVDVENLRCHG